MNFEFSEEQYLLREQAQRYLRDKSPLETVRAVLDDKELSHDAALWQGMIDLGWTGVSIPEQYGVLVWVTWSCVSLQKSWATPWRPHLLPLRCILLLKRCCALAPKRKRKTICRAWQRGKL